MYEAATPFRAHTTSGFWSQAGLVVFGGLVSVYTVLWLENISTALVGLILAAFLIALGCVIYLMKGLSFERAVVLMMLTLPMTEALVVDIGGSVRISYLFVILAMILTLRQGQFSIRADTVSTCFLHSYVIYALISVSYTLIVPDLQTLTSVGFRGSIFRSFIQFGQLLLMVGGVYVTLHYAHSLDRVEKLCHLIFWATVLTAIYGFYEFFAFLFDLPYINLNTTPLDSGEGGTLSLSTRLSEDWFAGSRRSLGGIDVPRVRSFMGEAQLLTSYLMFAIPCSFLAAVTSHRVRSRRLKLLCSYAFIVLFFLTNSRSGFVALAGVLIAAFIWAPSWRIRRWLMVCGVAFCTLIAFVLFPLLGAFSGIEGFLDFVWTTYESLVAIQGREGVTDDFLKVFLTSPVFGVGIGNYIFYLERSNQFLGAMVASIGNLYFHVTAELGIVGLMFFMGFIGSIFFGLHRIVRTPRDPRLRRAAFAIFIAFIGTMICHGAYSGLYTHMYIWVMWALGLSLIRIQAQRQLSFLGQRSNLGDDATEPQSLALTRPVASV